MPEAEDISRETAETQKLYGLDDPKTAGFGRQCLLARRLSERGVRFVQATHSDAAVQWDGNDPYFRDTRAVVLTRLGRPREAIPEADAALALPGGDLPEIRWHRALALDAAGRRREAEDAANEILGLPDVPADVLEQIGEWLARR